MSTTSGSGKVWEPKHPVNLNSGDLIQDKYKYYDWLRENAPVYRGKFMFMNSYLISRYEDCEFVLKDPIFARSRGNGSWSWLMPSSLKAITNMMLYKDGKEHRRLRTLVHKAFTPRAITKLDSRIGEICDSFLDDIEASGKDTFDLVPTYAYPLPVKVIGEMLGVPDDDMDDFQKSVNVLLQGLTGFRIIKTILWDLRKTVGFIKKIIAKKRKAPKDDILTALIQAEEGDDRFTEQELVSMVMLLIIAGYETTVDLIKCVTVALLAHPEQLQLLKENPELMDGAIEETLRFLGPVHGTELIYASEEVTIRGVVIPKGHLVTPLLGSANRDPDVFEEPNRFDITRERIRHLGFGKGIHYCLGAPLARLETKIAMRSLFARFPDLALAQPAETLTFQKVPLFHRFEQVPLRFFP